MRKGYLLMVLLLVFGTGLKAQVVNDTTVDLHMFSFHLSGHVPGGAIADRYGLSLGVGGGYQFKMANQWMIGADFSYFSSNEFKDTLIFRNIQDEYGDFINIFGEIGEARFFMRGFYGGLKAGRLFPVIGPNPNSGLFVTVSGGLLQYKTLIHQDGRDIPSINDEYRKGYDYLTNGFGLSQFIGYMHIDSHEPINFYVGFEFHQAWTQNRRDWNFDLMGPDLTKRQDFLYGIKIGWIFPLNKRSSDTYYFY